MSTETVTSEWTLLNYGDEEEEIEVVGFELTNVDGVTTLDYDSDFSFHMSTTVETTGPGTSIEIDTVVNSTNISEVDSTHTTHDTYLVERELEEGEVVETKTRHYSGSFSTDADMVSSTDTDVEGWRYVNDVLEQLLAGVTDYAPLLPWNWARSHPDAIRQYRAEERKERAERKAEDRADRRRASGRE